MVGARLEISPTNVTLNPGATRQYQAFRWNGMVRENVTQQATFETGDINIATIEVGGDRAGLLTARAAGKTFVRATIQGLAAETSVVVAPLTFSQLRVLPADQTAIPGETVRFVAVAIRSDNVQLDVSEMATWASEDPAIATVSDAAGSKGSTSAVMAGRTRIVARFAEMEAGANLRVANANEVSLRISPSSMTRLVGQTAAFQAIATQPTGEMTDVTNSVQWRSMTPTIAGGPVGMPGAFVCAQAGTAVITASSMGRTASATLVCAVEEIAAVRIVPAMTTMAVEKRVQFRAYAYYPSGAMLDVTSRADWRSENGQLAAVSNSGNARGIVTALAVGTVRIVATYQGLEGLSTVTIIP